MTLHLRIAGLPPMNTADGLSRWTRRKIRLEWESRVVAAVLMELKRWPAKPLDRAEVTITRCSANQPDYDGLVQGGKFLLDGLVKAGVLADDSPAVIGIPVYHWEHAPRGSGCVLIAVRPAPDTSAGVEIGPRIPASQWPEDAA